MTVFCYTKMKVNPPMRLGEKISKTREEQGLAAIQLSELTRIPLKYVIALESGSFETLPKTKAHRIAYVKECARHLGLSEDECLQQFEKESGLEDAPGIAHPRRSLKFLASTTVSIFLRNLLVGVMVLSFAGYLIWQIKGVLTPPALTLYSPDEGSVINDARTNIIGQTEKESQLTVNGQNVMVDEAGKFSTEIDLSQGVNTIQISATKKHGKTTTLTRHIVVRLSPALKPLGLSN